MIARILDYLLGGRATRAWAQARLAAARFLAGDEWADGLPLSVEAIDEDGRHWRGE